MACFNPSDWEGLKRHTLHPRNWTLGHYLLADVTLLDWIH